MQKRCWQKILLCIIFSGLTAMLSLGACVIVKNDDRGSAQSSVSNDRLSGMSTGMSNFDPQQYADAIWEPVVVPRVESMAVDFNELMAGLETDEDGTSRKYGYRLLEEGNLYNFAIKGTVRFLSINTSSMNGSATVEFAPFNTGADYLVSIGPVFRGSAIRDIQNTISLNDFENQVEFARLARELNNKVRDVVLAGIDFSQHIGGEAELIGVFAYAGRGSAIDIIPVRLTFNGE